MLVDNKGLYLEFPHQRVAGWLTGLMEFYGLYVKGLVLALEQPARESFSPTEIRKMSANTLSLPRSELLEGRGYVLFNLLLLAQPSGWHIVGTSKTYLMDGEEYFGRNKVVISQPRHLLFGVCIVLFCYRCQYFISHLLEKGNHMNIIGKYTKAPILGS